MLAITRIKRIYTRMDLDPDFGDTQPESVEAYLISVSPRQITFKERYEFIIFIPEVESTEESTSLISEVMNEFLPKGDHYKVSDFTDDEAENYFSNGSYAPILSFDPISLDDDKISFLWLIPPKHLMQ